MDVAVPSLLGDNLAARLRSTSLALVGVVGAAALAMVGLTLQYGVGLVSSGPIHEPAKAEVAPARAVAEPATVPRRTHRAVAGPIGDSGRGASKTEPHSVAPAPAPSPVEDTGGGPALVAEPRPEGGDNDARRHSPPRAPARPSPAPQAPAPQAAPVEQPVATPSSEPPPPIAEPPAAEPSPVPGKGNAYGRGSG